MDEAKKAEAQVKFGRAVELKRRMYEDGKEMKEIKAFFEDIAAEELKETQGIGEIIILDETGNGVRFKPKKSSVSKTALRELGVDDDIIDEATSEYIAFELF